MLRETASILLGAIWPIDAMGWSSILQSLATTIAIFIAGFWTYRLFIQRRQRYPRAKITHLLLFRIPIGGEKVVLRVTVRIENSGEVLLKLASGRVWVQQVQPLPPHFLKEVDRTNDLITTEENEYEWPLLSECNFDWSEIDQEVEPGESDEIHCDFVVDANVRSILVYSYMKNESKKRRGLVPWKKREIGWNTTTWHDFSTSDLPSNAKGSDDDE